MRETHTNTLKEPHTHKLRGRGDGWGTENTQEGGGTHTHTEKRMRKEERKPESPWWAPTSKKFSKRLTPRSLPSK